MSDVPVLTAHGRRLLSAIPAPKANYAYTVEDFTTWVNANLLDVRPISEQAIQNALDTFERQGLVDLYTPRVPKGAEPMPEGYRCTELGMEAKAAHVPDNTASGPVTLELAPAVAGGAATVGVES